MEFARPPDARSTTVLTKTQAIDLPILDTGYKAGCPHRFAALREAAGPLIKVRLPHGAEAWLALDDATCRRLLRDPRLSKAASMEGNIHPIFKHLLVTDPPEHVRLRKLLKRAISAEKMAALRPAVEALAEDLAGAIKPNANRRADLVEAYAQPLALHVICRLLEIPPADDLTVQAWSKALLSAEMEDPSRAFSIAQDIDRYFVELEGSVRAVPGGGLFRFLIEAMDNAEITSAELRASAFLMLAAGYETSANMIANGALLLLQTPSHWRAVASDVGFAARAVEEVLRFHSPLETSTPRRALHTFEIVGEHINAGDLVFAAIGAANRDPVCFTSAEAFAPGRREASRHLAFGTGPHACLGASLARLEGEVAFQALARAWPTMRLAIPADHAAWSPGLVMRGLDTLPVVLEANG